MKQILSFAEQQGARTLTFQGTFSSGALAEKFGKNVGDSFSVSAPATRQGLIDTLKMLQ